MNRWQRLIGLIALSVIVLSACGNDDGASVTQLDGDTSSGTGSGTASETASGVAAQDKECEAVGEDLEASATETVELGLLEYGFDPGAVTVPAGTVTFATTNDGTEAHELAFLPGGGKVPFTADGVPDEAALEAAGAFELEAYGPGRACNATYELDAGTYTMFCIVESADGTTHYELGMEGSLVVE